MYAINVDGAGTDLSEKDNHIPVGEQEDRSTSLYRVRSSQIPNALAFPLVLGLIMLVGTVLVSFYNSKDSLSERLRGDIAKSEARTAYQRERMEEHLGKELVELKVSTKENRNQIVVLWQRIGGGK